MRPEAPQQRLSPLWRGLVAVAVAAAVVVVAQWPQPPSNPAPPAQGTPARPMPPATEAPPPGGVALAELPPQAQRTVRLIRAGGPFPHEKDAAVFGNRERLLPAMPRGFYREYTVPTPGSRDRGARRIVCGGWQAREPQQCYYTDDHYASYRPIAW